MRTLQRRVGVTRLGWAVAMAVVVVVAVGVTAVRGDRSGAGTANGPGSKSGEVVVDEDDDYRPRRPVGGGMRNHLREREKERGRRERDSHRMSLDHEDIIEEYGSNWREHRDEIRERMRERARERSNEYRDRDRDRRSRRRPHEDDDQSYAGADDDVESRYDSDSYRHARRAGRYESERAMRESMDTSRRKRDRHDPHRGYYMFEARFVLRDAEANFEDTFDRANKWSERLDELTDAPCEVIPRNKEMLLVTVRDVTQGEHVQDLVRAFPDCTEVIFKTKFVPPIPKLRDL